MKPSFTLNQCLRMLYGETSPEESYMLREVIETNDKLNGEFTQMKKTLLSLRKTLNRPSQPVVENILKYSRDNALEFSL
jgi:hypothetical protein